MNDTTWAACAWRRTVGANSARINLVNGNYHCSVHTEAGAMTTTANDYDEAKWWCDQALAGEKPE